MYNCIWISLIFLNFLKRKIECKSLVNGSIGYFVGTHFVHNDVACLFNNDMFINIVLMYDEVTLDGSKLLINTQCGSYGAKFCPDDYETVLKLCTDSDIERFRITSSTPGSNGKFIERLISFLSIKNDFLLVLGSQGIDLDLEGEQMLVYQLHKFAL